MMSPVVLWRAVTIAFCTGVVPSGSYTIPVTTVPPVVARVSADEGPAGRQLFFLTPAMVLQRYGRPTRMSGNVSGVNWVYDDEREGDARVYISLHFDNGYLTAAYKMPRLASDR